MTDLEKLEALRAMMENSSSNDSNTDWEDDWEDDLDSDDLDSDDFMNEDPIESDIDVFAELRKILEERA